MQRFLSQLFHKTCLSKIVNLIRLFQWQRSNSCCSLARKRQIMTSVAQPNIDLDHSKPGNSKETESFVEQADQKQRFSSTESNFQDNKDEDVKKLCKKSTYGPLLAMSKSVPTKQDDRNREIQARVSSLIPFPTDCQGHSTTAIDSLHIPCKHSSKSLTDHLPSKQSNNELSNVQAQNTVTVPVESSSRQSDNKQFESTKISWQQDRSRGRHPRSNCL